MTTYPSLNPTYLEPDGQEFLPSWLGGVEIVVEVESTTTSKGYFSIEKRDERVQIYLEGLIVRQEGYAENLEPLFTFKELFKSKTPLKATLKRINFVDND